jgi:hypothetical protein
MNTENAMNSYRARWGLCAAVVVILGGCSATPVLDSKFGSSVSGAMADQILDPNPSRLADPVVGLDGIAAANAITRYHKSFTAPPAPANVFAIGVSGSSGGPSGSGGTATANPQ